jgi:alpha-beta hydrolase superfamily lysophospholipase
MDNLWTAQDGLKLPLLGWQPAGTPKALLVCVHGMGGAAGDFTRLGQAAAANGIAAFALNLREQGLDPRPDRRGTGLDLEMISDDLCGFITDLRREFPAQPLFTCGESMGALVTAWLLAKKGAPAGFSGAIFSAPVVQLRKPTPWHTRQALKILSALVPRGRFRPSFFVTGKSESLKVTRDPEHQEWVRNAPHRIDGFTFRFLNELGNLMESADSLATELTEPSLVMVGGNDVYIESRQVKAWFDRLAAEDRTFREYSEAYHLLWNDFDREAVLHDIMTWIDARVPATTNA